ncbi:hypothetical protein GCM10010502_71530 [Kitasatospora aureofaciens]|uniref:Uncharacterized protein n=1 Tax=Kitasatospora aureofaciens TaxID=1894 RepID=A0A8H9I0C2_KITAU|nr:hypothetical protein GCM10010502_71530 [Kitasatospora aureofaciens]
MFIGANRTGADALPSCPGSVAPGPPEGGTGAVITITVPFRFPGPESGRERCRFGAGSGRPVNGGEQGGSGPRQDVHQLPRQGPGTVRARPPSPVPPGSPVPPLPRG